VVDDTKGDVKVLNLSKDALNADFQIDNTMNIMEQMSGSPQNASGFRTPGEKTKFEVQVLEGGANRIFSDKTTQFETDFIEPVLMDIVALGRENLGQTDMVSTTSTEFNIETYLSVTRDELFVSGKMRARGSKRFQEKANALQKIMKIYSTGVGQQIAPHTSTKKLAQALEELAEFKEFGIIFPNIGIQEQVEQQQIAQAAQGQATTADAINVEDEALRAQQEQELNENT